jgi:hypothetical protein
MSITAKARALRCGLSVATLVELDAKTPRSDSESTLAHVLLQQRLELAQLHLDPSNIYNIELLYSSYMFITNS